MKQFSLPNLSIKNISFNTYFFNQKSYNFRFEWCESFVLMDIYIVLKGVTTYILKGFPIVADYNLIERIKTPEYIIGKLFIKNKYGQDIPITRENFSTDFELIYEEES